MKTRPIQTLEFQPVTPERWPDFEALFGKNGACAGCWCTWWRLARSQFNQQGSEGNRQTIRAVIAAGRVPGILAYADGQPAGWCAVAPRSEYASIERSPVLKRVDDQPVWSLTCFFIERQYRRQGLMGRLLEAAIGYARSQGAPILEAYPNDSPRQFSASELYMGQMQLFLNAGFVEVARRSAHRPILRLTL